MDGVESIGELERSISTPRPCALVRKAVPALATLLSTAGNPSRATLSTYYYVQADLLKDFFVKISTT